MLLSMGPSLTVRTRGQALREALVRAALLAALGLATGGCGNKGPLFLPPGEAPAAAAPAEVETPPAEPAGIPAPETGADDQDGA